MRPWKRYKTIISLAVLIPLFLLFVISHAAASLNGTETLITTDTLSSDQFYPVIFGDYIAWEDQRTPYSNIYLYNLATGEEYPPLPDPDPAVNLFQTSPAMDGFDLVWGQFDTSSGMYTVDDFNVSTRSTVTLPAGPGPFGGWMRDDHVFSRISQGMIVWQDYTSGDWDIYGYNMNWGNLTPVGFVSNTGDQKSPAISGNYFVYENWSGGNSDIWMYNLSNSTAVRLTTTTHAERPDISGNIVTWQDSGKIFRYFITTSVITPVTPISLGSDQQNPAIGGNRIVVEDTRRSANADIYLYDISSGEEIWVSPQVANHAQTLPKIYGNRIVWQDMRSGMSDIYLVTLGSADICPVADLLPSVNGGESPLSVTFTDTSRGSIILHKVWNYSDGSVNYPLHPGGEIFSFPGIYSPILTVGNLKCRNATPQCPRYDIYVNTKPASDFSASPLDGFAPLSVQFSDHSAGGPSTWLWDFGDGASSHEQNPVHEYSASGQRYTVSLIVNNTFAGMATDTKTKVNYVRTFLGASGSSALPVDGIVVTSRYSNPFLYYNATTLPNVIQPHSGILISLNPGDAGWQNITFISSDSSGFSDTFGNNTYMGNISDIDYHTNMVATSGVSPTIGTDWGVNYHLNTTSYPSPSSITTNIWESTTPTDSVLFNQIITGSNFVPTANGIAYTAEIQKSNIQGSGNATLNMSVDRSWVGGQEADTYIIGYGVNSQGNMVGKVIPARYLFNHGLLDYFEAEVPDYFTKFGITPLSGSGNPLQLITLTIASHASSGSAGPPSSYTGTATDSDSSSGSGKSSGVQGAGNEKPGDLRAPSTAETGITGTVYTNQNGVVTQASTIKTGDALAAITLMEGIVAKDDNGNPLSSITLSPANPGTITTSSSGGAFTFAGVAYELGPEGATFTPAAQLTFAVPQGMAGNEYTVRSYDHTKGIWSDLPTTYDPAMGKVTALVTHFCCFAVFSHPVTTMSHTLQFAPVAEVTPSPLPPPAPSTAITIFLSMMAFIFDLVRQNLLVLFVLICLVLLLYVRGRKKRMDRIRYLF